MFEIGCPLSDKCKVISPEACAHGRVVLGQRRMRGNLIVRISVVSIPGRVNGLGQITVNETVALVGTEDNASNHCRSSTNC